MNKTSLKLLKKNYEDACNGWVTELLSQWNLDASNGWWVKDEVGTVYIHEADFSLNMEEIIYCVENGVTLEEYWEFTEYCTKCNTYHFHIPNLEAYMKGCPRVPEETFEKLDSLREELDKSVKEAKNGLKY